MEGQKRQGSSGGGVARVSRERGKVEHGWREERSEKTGEGRG